MHCPAVERWAERWAKRWENALQRVSTEYHDSRYRGEHRVDVWSEHNVSN